MHNIQSKGNYFEMTIWINEQTNLEKAKIIKNYLQVYNKLVLSSP